MGRQCQPSAASLPPLAAGGWGYSAPVGRATFPLAALTSRCCCRRAEVQISQKDEPTRKQRPVLSPPSLPAKTPPLWVTLTVRSRSTARPFLDVGEDGAPNAPRSRCYTNLTALTLSPLLGPNPILHHKGQPLTHQQSHPHPP